MSQKFPPVRVAVRYRTTPCDWRESKSNGGSTLMFSTEGVYTSQKSRVADAWTVRQAFFGLSREDQVLPFLKDTGRFTHLADKEVWSYSDFEKWKQIIGALLRTPPEGWSRLVQDRFSNEKESGLAEKFSGRFVVTFAKEGKFYVGTIVAESTLLAMIATAYVDWMADVKQGFCKRSDCGIPFEITSAHERRYCTPECAHHEVVRRARERTNRARAIEKEVGPKDPPLI